MQAHNSFHFSPLRFPAVQNVSTVFLFPFCLRWPGQYTHPFKHFTVSNTASLGHFILIAKYSNLVYNVHIQSTLPTHGLITQKQQEMQEAVRSGQKPNYCMATQNLPLTLHWILFETHTSRLFSKGSSVSFLFLTLPTAANNSSPSRPFFSIAAQQPNGQNLFFSTPISTCSSFSGYITRCF